MGERNCEFEVARIDNTVEKKLCLLPALCYSNKSYKKWLAFRSKPCRYYINGNCRYAEKCNFSHPPNTNSEEHKFHLNNSITKTIEETLQKFTNIFLSALTAQSEEIKEVNRFVQNTIQKQDAETQTDQTLSVQEPNIFSICQESDIQVNLFGAEPLDWTPVSPIASNTPLRSPSTDDVELDSALDEIELLKQELQDMNRMNESDRVFYEEKIADMEFSLNELSALTISTGDSLTASQILEELKSSQIEESIIRKRFSVGDVVQCQITGEIGEIRRTYTRKVGVKFSSGYRTCLIENVEKKGKADKG